MNAINPATTESNGDRKKLKCERVPRNCCRLTSALTSNPGVRTASPSLPSAAAGQLQKIRDVRANRHRGPDDAANSVGLRHLRSFGPGAAENGPDDGVNRAREEDRERHAVHEALVVGRVAPHSRRECPQIAGHPARGSAIDREGVGVRESVRMVLLVERRPASPAALRPSPFLRFSVVDLFPP